MLILLEDVLLLYILNDARLAFREIQNGRQDGCRNEVYSDISLGLYDHVYYKNVIKILYKYINNSPLFSGDSTVMPWYVKALWVVFNVNNAVSLAVTLAYYTLLDSGTYNVVKIIMKIYVQLRIDFHSGCVDFERNDKTGKSMKRVHFFIIK